VRRTLLRRLLFWRQRRAIVTLTFEDRATPKLQRIEEQLRGINGDSPEA